MTGGADGDLSWVREESPVWDADKARVIGGAPEGAFVLTFSDGEGLPGDWWSARTADGEVVGYGRLDTTWGGDAEILLAVAPDRQESGIGTFILGKLDEEAASRGLNYIHNRIRDHEQRDAVHVRYHLVDAATSPGRDVRRFPGPGRPGSRARGSGRLRGRGGTPVLGDPQIRSAADAWSCSHSCCAGRCHCACRSWKTEAALGPGQSWSRSARFM